MLTTCSGSPERKGPFPVSRKGPLSWTFVDWWRAPFAPATSGLWVFGLLAALGGTDAQLRSHALGNLRVGNDGTRQLTALMHCFPYIGFPRALNAIRVMRDAVAEDGT